MRRAYTAACASLATLVFTGLGCATGSSSRSSAEPAAVPAASTLPDFRLQTIDGDRFVLSDHVGRDVIVLSFWATWCKPCLAELPHLSEMYDELNRDGLVVVAVSMDEPNTQSEVAPTARRLRLQMPVVIDAEQRAVRLYNKGRDAPLTVVIDRSGNIVQSQAGYHPGDEAKLKTKLEALLAL